MESIIIREIQPSDNKQIANVIRQVFIVDDYPKKELLLQIYN